MDEKTCVERKPPSVVQPVRRRISTTLLGLVAALSFVAFFHQRPLHEDGRVLLENQPVGQWTWNDVSCPIVGFLTVVADVHRPRSRRAENWSGKSAMMESLTVRDST